MANATYRDCRAGFDVFMRHGGGLSQNELNVELIEAGYNIVSDRTFGHYRKLLRAGFDRYISINRFDISRAAIPFEDSSANPRYNFAPSDQGVRMLLAKGSDLYVAAGRSSQLGEVGCVVRVMEPEFVEGLRRLRVGAGNMVSVRFMESGVTVEGRLVEVDLESSPAHLEIEFSIVTSLYEVGIRSPIPMVSSRVTLQSADSELIQLDVASRRLFHFFDLVEGLRSVLNHSLSSETKSNYAEPPVLVQLQVASPALLDILGAPELVDLLRIAGKGLIAFALYQLPQRRKEWFEGTGKNLENELLRQKLEEGKLALQERRSTTELKDAIAHRLGMAGSKKADELGRAVEEHVVPALMRLARQGVSALDVEVLVPDPSEARNSSSVPKVSTSSRNMKNKKRR